MNNPSGSIEIGLGTFGGNNLDMDPTDLPQGLSPDCSDMAFLPGQVFTRPSLKRLSSVGTSAQAVYSADFKKPDGTVSSLTFYSDGGMYSDGVKFGQTLAGNRFHVENAFGKAYIAISDGNYGADVPLQFTPEGFLDRVSQDGPGAPPVVSNYSLPSVALVTGSGGSAVTIDSAMPINPEQVQFGAQRSGYEGVNYTPPSFVTYYTSLQFTTTAPHGLTVGEVIVIAGNSLYNFANATVTAVDGPTQFEVSLFSPSPAIGNGGTVTPSAPFLVRNGNVVTANTADPHSLRSGYQVTISGVADQSSPISTIVIDNETNSGIATVTTPTPHGLVPDVTISLLNIPTTAVGGGIATWAESNGVATVTTNTPHFLTAGTDVIVTFGGFAGAPQIVATVSSTTSFTFPLSNGLTSGIGGTVELPWPLASGSQVQVQTVPNATTFTFSFAFNDGTWTGGTFGFAWNGTFFVTSVLSATAFQYSQVGPNALIQSGTGTVTPAGQISPGTHSIVQIFLTRTGYLTIPSPPVQVNASGGQYLFLSSAAIGPSNVVARWFGITGANGGKYFVIPVPPRDPAQQYLIGTSTVMADNTTTSAIFDFSDESLFDGIGIDIPGNNLFALEVLGPCLGFFSYASRLMPWGERNKIQQFLNMGFEGGFRSSAPNSPLGWTITGSDGTLTSGDYGDAWTATTATISQSAYQDRNGIAIIQPNTLYTYRAWVNGTSVATLSSASMGFSTSVSITGTGNFAQGNFTSTPVTIPTDLVITISQVGKTTHDELEIIYTLNPRRLTSRASYVNNPESFDGVTGLLGPAADPHPVWAMEERKDVLCFLTNGPNGSLYETEDTPSGEPVTWDIRHIASECGAVSVWGITKFEDWFEWISDTGLRIFDGSNIEKMSQELQPWWNTLNPKAKQFSVLANDPITRRTYIVAAVGTATSTNAMYVLDYQELNTASLLANAGTLRIGYSGKVVTTDLTRKWSPWSMTMNYAGLLTQPDGSCIMTFCGGTGGSLSDSANSAIYTLNEGVISGIDADYGPFWAKSTYPSYFFLSTDDAQQRQLGAHRLLHSFLTANITGVGSVFFLPEIDRVGNAAAMTRALTVTEDLARDLEWALNVAAERISYRLCCQPTGPQPAPATAPAGFRMSSMTVAVKTHPFSPIRGKNS